MFIRSLVRWVAQKRATQERTYSARHIAAHAGLYSTGDNPHGMLVHAIMRTLRLQPIEVPIPGERYKMKAYTQQQMLECIEYIDKNLETPVLGCGRAHRVYLDSRRFSYKRIEL